MNKLEFSDVNKFLTSLGLIFIGLAFVIPWLFVQQNALLTIKNEDLKSFTKTAQLIVNKQQLFILKINEIIPYLSCFLFVTGILLVFVGIYYWWKRQNVLDKIQDEDLIFKQIQNLSWKEKREIIEEEINNLNDSSELQEIDKAVDNYLEIEDVIYSNIALNYSNSYKLYQNVKIENSEYDLILKKISPHITTDKIIEIKYYNNDIRLSNLQNALSSLLDKCKTYTNSLNKKCAGVLIIIYEKDELPDKLLKYKIEIQKTGKNNEIAVRVQFIKYQTLINGNKIELFK